MATLTVLPCVTSWPACFTEQYLWKIPLINSVKSSNPATSKMEFFLTLVNVIKLMSLTNVTRGSIIDVAGVLDTLLELVTINSLKMNNCDNVNNNNKKLVKQFFRGIFPGAILLGGIFLGVNFPRGFFPRHFFRHPLN